MPEGLLITFWATNAKMTTSRIGNAALLKNRFKVGNQRTRGVWRCYSVNAAT